MNKNKILVVDDSSTNNTFFCSILERENVEVLSASNGKEAIEIAKNNSPDLVILDIVLPEINGIEVLKQLKQLKQNIPVLIISGISDTKVIRKAKYLGATDYFIKPILMQELLKKIAQLIPTYGVA